MRRVVPTAICFLLLNTTAIAQDAEKIERRSAEPAAVPAQSAAGAEDQLQEERWQQAAQLKHPSFEEKFSIHQPVELCLRPNELKKNYIGSIDWYVFKVVDVAGPNEVLIKLDNGPPISVRDGSSEGLTKNQDVIVGGLVRVMGTMEYQSADGSSMTIMMLRLLNKDQTAQAAKYRQQAIDQAFRTWHSNKGNHKIEARFVKFEKSKVHLLTREGKKITIAPKDLSVPDRKYYRGLLKGEKPKK
jgi:hypothetical protein